MWLACCRLALDLGLGLTILLDTIKASGVLSMAVYQWERLPKAQQTVTHLEDYFTAEDTLQQSDPGSITASLTINAASTLPGATRK